MPSIEEIQARERELRAAQRQFVKPGPYAESDRNIMRARMISNAERFDDDGTRGLELSDDARDKFLYYGRQDGAHALLNSISLLRKLWWIEKAIWLLIVVVTISAWFIVDALHARG